MTNSKKLTELAQQCSAITKEKGFFDVWAGDEIGLLKHNVLQQYGELAEAYEAKRKGKFYTGEFEKDTFEDELADVCIFGLSCLGYFDYEVKFSTPLISWCYYDYEEFYLSIIELFNSEFSGDIGMLIHINNVLVSVVKYCEHHNIDIFMHIEQKMQYNASREKLHGKKF